jgi:hypothetical protein
VNDGAPIAGLEPGLVEALEARGAQVTHVEPDRRKLYIRARAPEGDLFAWQGAGPESEAVIDHEIAARAVIGTEGALRSPPILARGRNWRIEPAVGEPSTGGRSVVEAAVAAIQALLRIDLPVAPRAIGRERVAAKLIRRARLVRSGLAPSEVARARSLLASSPLPPVPSHGDFRARHLLFDGDGPWVIDWELSRRQPAGFDLMTLWADLPEEDDRAQVFDLCLDMLGRDRRAELLELRYALVVRRIADQLGKPEVERDGPLLSRLLGLLPGVRDAARGARDELSA